MPPVAATRQQPTRGVPGRILRGDAPRELSYVQRLTLFLTALHPQRARELVDGLAPKPRTEALAFADVVARWSSSARQARLALDFGTRSDARERIEALLHEASPAMRFALLAALPESLRAHFDGTAPAEPAAPESPALTALAQRLVREAIR